MLKRTLAPDVSIVATVTVPLLRDVVDSYYKYVQARCIAKMAILAPQVKCIVNNDSVPFQFGGIANARDWPMPPIILGAPYLLVVSESPIAYGGTVSQYSPQIVYKILWVWSIQGDNIRSDQQAANRGNKYSINIAILQAMQYAHYPGFTQKLQWGIVADSGTGQPVNVVTPYDPPDFVRWGMPKFTDKIDRTSGILYCSGSVSLVAFAPEIPE